MKELFIIFTSLILFIGCGSSNSGNSSKVEIKSTHSSYDNTRLSITDHSYIEYITTLGLNGEALDIDLSDDGNFAYIASGDFGLQVIDISDPEYPRLIATYESYGYVNHVEVIGDIVYLSYIAQTWDDYERVNAYDITYPHDAKYLGYYEGYKSNNHQSFDCDDYLYQIVGNDFYVVNKSRNDYQRYKLYDPHSLMVSDGYAYIANGRDGLTILKVKGYANRSILTNSWSKI